MLICIVAHITLPFVFMPLPDYEVPKATCVLQSFWDPYKDLMT